MKQLLIKNKGLAPIESFTILGLSTARGSADLIGQFGSGSKHGILTLMRNKIPFRIFIGDDELTFHTESKTMLQKHYEEVLFTFKGQTHKTGTCLDFGSLDWEKTSSALREFISNALDQGERPEDILNVVYDATSSPNETRIFVDATPEVMSYYKDINKNFLHFSHKENLSILPAMHTKETRFYRRGVFVRAITYTSDYKCLFDYNMHDEKIDEARNMDGTDGYRIMASLLASDLESLTKVMKTFSEIGVKYAEHQIGFYLSGLDNLDKSNVRNAWQANYGEMPFVYEQHAATRLLKKGIKFVIVPWSWADALRQAGIECGHERLTEADTNDYDLHPITESAKRTFEKAWKILEKASLTLGKAFPKIGTFTTMATSQGETRGFYDRTTTTCYLSLDDDTNVQTALEELSHYITGATDESREFQEFAFKLATRLGKLHNLA